VSYEDYLRTCPEGRDVNEARWCIEQEENAWADAEESGDYEHYLDEYPEGKHADDARSRSEDGLK
jgi:hypothetical protein